MGDFANRLDPRQPFAQIMDRGFNGIRHRIDILLVMETFPLSTHFQQSFYACDWNVDFHPIDIRPN
jgi:hypothetical protein